MTQVQQEVIPKIRRDIERTADFVRRAGGHVEINYGLPCVSVDCPDGSAYFFQEHEAETLLDRVPPNVFEDDFILWSSQNW